MALSALGYYLKQIYTLSPHLKPYEPKIISYLEAYLQQEPSLTINQSFVQQLEAAIGPTSGPTFVDIQERQDQASQDASTPQATPSESSQAKSDDTTTNATTTKNKQRSKKTSSETSPWTGGSIALGIVIVVAVGLRRFVGDLSQQGRDSGLNTQPDPQPTEETALSGSEQISPETGEQRTPRNDSILSFQEVPSTYEIILTGDDITPSTGQSLPLPPLFVTKELTDCLTSYQGERRTPPAKTMVVTLDENNVVIGARPINTEQDIDVVLGEVSKRVSCTSMSPVRLDTPQRSRHHIVLDNGQKEVFEVYEFEVNGETIAWKVGLYE